MLTRARMSAAGRVIPGAIHCFATPEAPYFYHQVQAYAPHVAAANTTYAVDRQWVYWRARVLEEGYLNPTHEAATWTTWTWAYAADNAWTSDFFRADTNQRLDQGRWYWNLFRGGGYNTTQFVENEVWFTDGQTWSFGGTFRSVPSSNSGSNNGVGYCAG